MTLVEPQPIQLLQSGSAQTSVGTIICICHLNLELTDISPWNSYHPYVINMPLTLQDDIKDISYNE